MKKEDAPLTETRRHGLRDLLAPFLLLALALLGACATHEGVRRPQRRPADVRAQIVQLLPANTDDREGWAVDIYAALASLGIEPSTQNLCATLAVTEQESGFQVHPVVPDMGRIAAAEINRRAAQHHVPQVLVRGALSLRSPDGKSYEQRLRSARTEQDLSRIYEDFIGMVPLGRRLFGGDNPVHTAGPMQVSVAFAETFAHDNPYPYPIDGSLRHELFSRRGGMYFGIAHLLGYPVNYPRMIYHFADFNAGWYASRNAAFQHALSLTTGIPLALDGDLVRYDSSAAGSTELAARTLAERLDLSDAQIHRELALGEKPDFTQSKLYVRLFALAEQFEHKSLPRAMLPGITLKSPKITRKLTTAWFAQRVDDRYQRCLTKAPAG